MVEEEIEYPKFEDMRDYVAVAPPSPDLTRWQLSSEDLLYELEHDLRGEVWNEQEKKWMVTGIPLLNDSGVRLVLSVVRSRVNKIAFLSNLDDEIIKGLVLRMELGLISLFSARYEYFGIDITMLETIVDKVADFVLIALLRAKDEGERKFLRSTERRIERIIQRPEERKRVLGIF